MQIDSESPYSPPRHTDRSGALVTSYSVQQQSQGSGFIPSQNSYGSITMTGGSLHQGDQYYFTNENVAQKEISRFLESIWFPEINMRANQITDAHQETLRWVLKPTECDDNALSSDPWPPVSEADELHDSSNPERSLPASSTFSAWILGDEPMFWVAGKPGSGKSTLMKFLSSYDQSKDLLRHRFHNQNVRFLRHFFWLHGSDMQRSMKGCLCTLIHQVLQSNDELVLATLRKNLFLRGKRNTHDWSESELQELLFDLLAGSGEAFGVFIDGLDEHDTHSDVRPLLELVQGLAGVCNVKICASSRQDNVFERAFSRRLKLRLQDLTHTDMHNMARARLMVEMQDGEVLLSDIELDTLAYEVAYRAEGVFLWATTAIRALAIGIRDDYSYESLLERLKDLPAEMEDLCSHILMRVNANGRKNLESCLMYLALAKLGPGSLLTFTLAADEQILRQVTHNKGSITESGLRQLLQACRTMKSTIRAVTAGILEVVESGEQDEASTDDQNLRNIQRDICQPGLCTCPQLFSTTRCFVSLPYAKEFREMHRKSIQYMHRDIAENFDLARDMNLSGDCKVDLCLQAQKRFLAAILVEHKLGCRCDKLRTTSNICHLLHDMGEGHASATMEHLLNGYNIRSILPEEDTCWYGWAHEVISPASQTKLRWGLGYSPFDSSVLDFQGLMAWLGYLNFFEIMSYDASTWSSYYKGYLCACAAKAPKLNQEQLYLGKGRVIAWLIENGADLLSPQVARPTIGVNDTSGIVAQTPIVDCWCFILRLLEEPLLDRGQKLHICNTLVPLILAQKCFSEELVVWTVTVNAHTEGKDEMLSHNLQGHDLEFILQTTIYELQVCVLESVSNLRGGHQHKIVFPSLKTDGLVYLYWKPAGKRTYEFLSRERHMLNFKELRQTRFKTIEPTAFEVLVNRKTIRLRSMARLVDKLEQWRPHSTTCKSHGRMMVWSKTENITLARSLNVAPYHSFYMFYDDGVRLVPPDSKRELEYGQWYEHGALREWHERRRMERWKPSHDSTFHLHKYEEHNLAIGPSYLPPLASNGKSREEVTSNAYDDTKFSSTAHLATRKRRHSESTIKEDTSSEHDTDSDVNSSETSKSAERSSTRRKRIMKSAQNDTNAPLE